MLPGPPGVGRERLLGLPDPDRLRPELTARPSAHRGIEACAPLCTNHRRSVRIMCHHTAWRTNEFVSDAAMGREARHALAGVANTSSGPALHCYGEQQTCRLSNGSRIHYSARNMRLSSGPHRVSLLLGKRIQQLRIHRCQLGRMSEAPLPCVIARQQLFATASARQRFATQAHRCQQSVANGLGHHIHDTRRTFRSVPTRPCIPSLSHDTLKTFWKQSFCLRLAFCKTLLWLQVETTLHQIGLLQAISRAKRFSGCKSRLMDPDSVTLRQA